MMTMRTYDDIMADLAHILATFGGRDYGGPITPHTMFSRDLGLASIDAVVLGESIEEHYGRKLSFSQFLAELGRTGARDIEVGALANFLVKHLNQPSQ
jgi:acyl carrier protein